MCKVLNVSRSGYYKYISNLNCSRKIQANELLGKIADIYNESKGRYGSPRIHQQLKREGVSCNHKTVEKLMAKNNCQYCDKLAMAQDKSSHCDNENNIYGRGINSKSVNFDLKAIFRRSSKIAN